MAPFSALLRARRALAAMIVLGMTSACTAAGTVPPRPQDGDDRRVRVTASFYPITFLAERIGGPGVAVTSLTPPGTEPHDLVLDGRALAAVHRSDLVLYLGSGFQPDVERAVAAAGAPAVDLLDAPGLALLPAPGDLGKEPLTGSRDPHVWLDPVRMQAMAGEVARALTRVRPEAAARHRRNLRTLTGELDALHAGLRSSLADCAVRTLVTSHAAFGYLADRYRLRQIAIAGVSPDDEPDPRGLAETAAAARRAGVRTVFFEEALPADLAETVAAGIGARTSLLAALEFPPVPGSAPGVRDPGYLDVMRANADRLRTGLGCR